MGKYIGQETTYGLFDTQVLTSLSNGVLTTFNLNYKVATAASIIVVYSGSVLQPGTSYSIVSGGTQISFNTAPQTGFSLYIVYLGKELSVPATTALSFVNGNVTNPAITFLDDSDTGFFRAAENSLGITTGGVERVRIDSNGSFGLGTSSPLAKLDIRQTDGISPILHASVSSGASAQFRRYSSDGNGSWIMLQKSRGTNITEHVALQDDDQVGVIYFMGSNGASFPVASSITCHVDGAPSSSVPGRLAFGVNNGTSVVTALTLTSTSRVGIGTQSPSYQLQVSTDSAAKPTTNTWTIVSDERIKTNIVPYTKGLSEINQVNPITYDYNGKGGMQAGPGGVSIIAQQIQSVFPECVGSYRGKLEETDTEEVDILNYNGHAITFALINAVKELSAKIVSLEARIEELEGA